MEEEDEIVESPEKFWRGRNFTLKRLVRLLHIDRPVFHVMAILGKRLDMLLLQTKTYYLMIKHAVKALSNFQG